MSDDLDDLVRRAMKTLDDQMPAGYFEGLPSRTLARLEDGSSMESQGTRQDSSKPSAAAPVVATTANQPPPSMSTKKSSEDREEDSGLHDIRSLASSTKARLSSRRSTQNPTVSEDDILASSSAGWKAVALPEPAKMISLPELAELPSAVDIEKQDKVARAEAKAEAKAAAAAVKRAKTDPAKADSTDTPAVTATPAAVTPIGSRVAAKPASGKTKGTTIAIVGALVAAAAGAAIFLVVNNKNQDTAPSAAAVDSTAKKERAMPALAAPPAPKAPAPIVEPIATGSAEQVAAVEPVAEEKPKATATEKKDKVHKVEIRDERPAPKEAAKPAAKVEQKEPPKEGDPDFDQLLKEAGVSDQKKAEKPKLDKKDLSGNDFKNGMNAVQGKARGCYKGTQGTAKFKVAISPEGKVTSVTMKGDFAGKPEGTCVEAAVRSASFPAWDGAPKSFDYSYLLSD